ncbi:hypothetical protein RHGRI_021759 [Rhododendron griersonianum]|uniref:QWRF motif-containing protein 2 n=1 Tax=Rhododendron griersonianum TaxID=479676 RepID=A0AAV6JRF5_9ERIC|nr:hypothetical protein RHGRI_021759 [Rhododendron griersonianum]
MVAAVSTTPHPKTNNPPKKPARPPLLPNAESDNVPPLPSRKTKSREITSRYMSSTSSSGSTTTTTSGNSSTTSSSSTNSSSYCSPSFSLKRHPSPSAAKTTPSTPAPGNPAAAIKRSLSVDRRRPSTPSNSAAANLLVSSKRSLSVSFQGGDTFSRPISRTKPAPEISPPAPATNGSSSLRRGTPERPVRDKTESTNTSGVRRGTPERRRATPVRDKAENFIPIDQHRWPGRSREANSSVMTRSLDCGGGDDRRRLGGSESVVRALGQSMTVDQSRTSLDRRLNVEPTSNVEFDANSVVTRSLDCTAGGGRKLGGSESVARLRALEQSVSIVDRSKTFFDRRLNVQSTNNAEFDGNSVGGGSVSGTESVVSDVESVSSICSRVVQERGSVAQARGGPRGIIVPARFWQETTNRVRRMQEPKSPVLGNNGVKTIALTPKLNALNKSFGDGSILLPRGMLNSRSLSSPIRGAVRPASPNKPPSRGMVSPSRVRNGMTPISLSNDLSRTPSILSFAAETRRGKVGENRVVDAHSLRLLHNRHLQWRFINARADAAMLAQKVTAEKSLYNAWVTTAKLWHSVKTKRAELQTLRSNLKLHSILKGQMLYLEDWDLMDRDHSSSLSGATEALEASTVRLPVGGGARADIQNVKDAICSAVDVMQGMASSICSLLTKVDQVNSVASELANVTAMERALLGQCKDLLSTLTAMQITYATSGSVCGAHLPKKKNTWL